LVPALARSGDQVCESMVCVEYVDEAFPAGMAAAGRHALLPPMSDPGARARCRYWWARALLLLV
jgi:glutathione S-transferase